MKAIWTGSIGFGLVNIPIKLYSAVENSELDLDMLDKKDHANIKFKRVNEKTGKEVAWENIVRGYLMDDKYVILDDKDFEGAAPEKTKIIEIAEFIDISEINSMYYEMPYYAEPEKNGAKAYTLLRDALKKSGKAGLGSFVLRTKESLCIIKAEDDVMVINRIRFAQEIRQPELKIPATTSKPAEIKMAMELIKQLSGSFDISKYKDTYTEKLMKIIRAKSKGKQTAAPTLKVVHSKATDLMAQLKASLGGSRKKAS
ncbi:non-homologous end joining protein Ku [Sediminibacterium ginsengisoli]|uniref:Non-homologous end joining protein Ku n=1 Tax=Sediminibacterium ginsengisoli TaxID=413434 RepID=A0A1T4Q4K3_9BACT|nr:Ku protein [Sediminibacterium ginsengisoli]SJZ98467.1 DNA end-binding protein Ku [Sediminibacterium ginsengisoli]